MAEKGPHFFFNQVRQPIKGHGQRVKGWTWHPSSPTHTMDYYCLCLSQTVLCGNQSLRPWEPELDDFGRCFQVLVLLAPSHIALALACAYGMVREM
jgi:hypothetical protein